ncbi:hypothetical protein [Pelagicoccus mobilis]|uniref:Uncharacterized protein n=1 Tax=Pelagicoccus mobilis TaxID=415221 RepID=A0A934RUK3_9BACT|nr:hypothetical protein [Pelagicoccus mobilis]MBK1877915.1 hypothetical protein [Pelagicoccus mobilis]
MKLLEKILAYALIVSAIGLASPAFSQIGEKESGAHHKRLLSRVLKNPDSAPEGVKQDIIALRVSQEEIRRAWVNEYRPEKGATTSEIREAREAFQSDYAEQIEASRELRISVMNQLRDGARRAIDESEWSEEARTLYQEYQGVQSELDEAWKAVKAELGEDATRKEVNAARRRFDEANADLVAKQKELAVAVRQLIRDNRDRTVSAREPLPEELQTLRSDMNVLRDELRQRKQEAHEDMRGMSRREREQYRKDLLDELKELHDEIKERRRQVIDEVRDGQTGDRRPEG